MSSIPNFLFITLWALLIILSGTVAPKCSGTVWGAFVGALGCYIALSVLGWPL